LGVENALGRLHHASFLLADSPPSPSDFPLLTSLFNSPVVSVLGSCLILARGSLVTPPRFSSYQPSEYQRTPQHFQAANLLFDLLPLSRFRRVLKLQCIHKLSIVCLVGAIDFPHWCFHPLQHLIDAPLRSTPYALNASGCEALLLPLRASDELFSHRHTAGSQYSFQSVFSEIGIGWSSRHILPKLDLPHFHLIFAVF